MSKPLRAVGQLSAERREVAGGVDADDVLGQVDRLALAAGRASRRARVDLIGLEQRVADRLALRGEEREAHRATDHERVDDVEQRFDHAELVGDLGAAEHGDERALRVVAQAEQDVDLLLQQQPHRRRQRLRRADDRGVGAVRGTERVVDVGVDALDQRRRRTPGRCPPRPGRSAGSRAARRRAPARRGARGPASIEYFGFGSPFGRPRWLAHDHVAPRSVSHSIVGSAARMRKSSVIVPSSSIGTLKSVRTRTRLPLTSPRSSSVGMPRRSICALLRRLDLAAGVQRGVDEAVASSPTRCRTSRAP